MKILILICLFKIVTAVPLSAQDVRKCDSDILVETSDRIGSLREDEIERFLRTFGKECDANVEFSEWSNELLFKVIDSQTDLTLKILERKRSKIEINAILDDLRSPIHDLVNIPAIIEKVKGIDISSELKRKIIEALENGSAE